MSLYSYGSIYSAVSNNSSLLGSPVHQLPSQTSSDVVSWNPHTSTRFNVISNKDIHNYKIDSELFNKVVESGFDDLSHISNRKQEGMTKSSTHNYHPTNMNQGEKLALTPPFHNQSEIFHHMGTTTLPYAAKCHAWHPSPDHKDVIALGLLNGTVVLNNVASNKIVTEFVPKSLRPCKSISWNPVQTNLIAAGFDKVRSDGGVVVWDVNMLDFDTSSRNDDDNGVLGDYASQSYGRAKNLPERLDKPLYEVGLSDAASSVCWIPGQRVSFIMGTNLRYMRVFDLRDYTNLKTTRPSMNFIAHNKTVQGICFNPFDSNQFASFSDDGQVKIWDLRKLPNVLRELPISTKRDPSISQMEWSPTTRNVLGILMRDGTSIRLWDMSSSGVEKSIKFKLSSYTSLYSKQDPISSFSFHPIISRCMLASTTSGNIKYLFTKEYPKFSISPTGAITSSHQKLLIERQLPSKIEERDYCNIMKTRAKKSIGVDFAKNWEVANEMKEGDMIELWSWASRIKILNENSDRKVHPSQFNYTGVRGLLTAPLDAPLPFTLPPPSAFTSSRFSSSPATSPTSPTSYPTETFETQARIAKIFPSLRVYSSPHRSLVIEMCGWGESLLQKIHACLNSTADAADNNPDIAQEIAAIKNQYLNERSVAIAIFGMNLNLAAKLLIAIEDYNKIKNNVEGGSTPQGNNYKFLAYALGGFSSDRQREFKEVYTSLYPMHPNPYLRAALGFLAELSSTYDYSTVLNETRISLCDRLAFASMYLSYDNLIPYVNRMTDEVIQRGNLQGIVLTGLTRDAVDLLQNYVDRTGDIQIASLLLKNVVPAQFEDKRVDMWLYNYREVLDQWQMWESRAFLDTKLAQYSAEKVSTRSAPEVSVKCSFCNQALVHKTLSSNRRSQITNFTAKMGSGTYATRPKTTSCPSCRKPLPKCSICLMPFGSPSHSLGGSGQSPVVHHADDNSNQYGQLDYCFSWCTKCKHGGHVKHLMEWFSNHTTCAVSGCDCNCMS